jgi:hypothetical protein
MASLSSVPDPFDRDPASPEPPSGSSPADAGQATRSGRFKLGGLSGKAGSGERSRKLSGPVDPYIATPAPKSYARAEPARDVDEHRSRSTMYDNDDAVDVAATPLRCLNAWIRTRKALFDGDPDAGEPQRRQPLLVRERFGLQKLAQISQLAAEARAAVEQLPVGEPGDQRAARERRDAIQRANRLAHRAMQIEYRLNAIRAEIDTAAQRVHDDIAGIIGHTWLRFEQRAADKPDDKGIWRTRAAAREHAQIAFENEFRTLPIPSSEEIHNMIKTERHRLGGPSGHQRDAAA